MKTSGLLLLLLSVIIGANAESVQLVLSVRQIGPGGLSATSYGVADRLPLLLRMAPAWCFPVRDGNVETAGSFNAKSPSEMKINPEKRSSNALDDLLN